MSDLAWDSETNRVAALHALRLLDTPREERFDRITRMAQDVVHAPIALVSLVDLDRQWFKSCVGLDATETSRGTSVCSFAIRHDEVFEVEDLTADERFADFPVVREAGLRFYAGQPVAAPSGHKIGTLCVLDRVPRRLTPVEHTRLKALATWVELECAVVQATLGAQDAERAKRDFVAMVSHELRTPLTSVHGSLELLASGRFGVLEERASQLLDIAVNNTDRLVRLSDDVLDLSKVRCDQLRLHPTSVDLDRVVVTAVHAVEGTAERDGVPLTTEVEPVTVRGDADRLVQAVTNLLSNAVKASPRGHAVTVGCTSDGSLARIKVVDEGSGIPADQVQRIFEPFVQLGRGGSGLGLTITRGIVDAHGGAIAVESVPGKGSTFTMTLPLAGPHVDRPWW
ncbi:GAF domain-containing sensor histidine kinase [Saccharothrix violaceirubra]|uniref:histidine kinase n=1 Tax=Saccharothrix violaceirubra TaxID=413306 RepID=A0A7W7WV54_9PSEU|nr:GAF domain-containing sensor histidine kinase [Saccharothrix violaceirubra]MBB4964954.1 signal transduction histidine kinase [Saccharothrix violaceirubra]